MSYHQLKLSTSRALTALTCAYTALLFAGCDGNLNLSSGTGGTYVRLGTEIEDINLALDSAERVSVQAGIVDDGAQDSDYSASSSDESVATITPVDRAELGEESNPELIYFSLRGLSEGTATITLRYEGSSAQETSFEVIVQPSAHVSYELSTPTLIEGSHTWADCYHYNAEEALLKGAISFEELDLEGATVSQSAANQLELRGLSAGEYSFPLYGEERQFKVVALSDVSDIALQFLINTELRVTNELEAAEITISSDSTDDVPFQVQLKGDDWFTAPSFAEGSDVALRVEVLESSTEVCEVVGGEEWAQFGILKPYNWGLRGKAAGSCQITVSLGELTKELIFTVQ